MDGKDTIDDPEPDLDGDEDDERPVHRTHSSWGDL